MGTLRSLTIDVKGHVYNGVILGDPVELDGDPSTFEFDDPAFPYGVAELNEEGELIVIPDEPTE